MFETIDTCSLFVNWMYVVVIDTDCLVWSGPFSKLQRLSSWTVQPFRSVRSRLDPQQSLHLKVSSRGFSIFSARQGRSAFVNIQTHTIHSPQL
jgi:hypothetical protein